MPRLTISIEAKHASMRAEDGDLYGPAVADLLEKVARRLWDGAMPAAVQDVLLDENGNTVGTVIYTD